MMMGHLSTNFAIGAWEAREGVRSLWRSPGTSVPVVVTLGLGLGLLSAVFAVADAVLLRPLPFHDPHRLVEVVRTYSAGGWEPYVTPALGRELLEWAGPDHGALYTRREFVRTDGSEAVTVVGWETTPELFGVLGVAPIIGRSLSTEDRGMDRLLLTHGYWRRTFDGDPAGVGATLHLNGRPYTVVGILPPAMDRFPHISGGSDVWLASDPAGLVSEGDGGEPSGVAPSLVVRLPPGESMDAWTERLATLQADFRARRLLPESSSLRIQPLGSWRTTVEAESAIWMVLGAAFVLLLVTILNSGNLLLVEARRRSRDIRLRMALGAGRARIARAAVVRSVVMAVVAGSGAAVTASATAPIIASLLPSYFLRFSVHTVEAGPRLFLFTGVTALGVALSLGLAVGTLTVRGIGGIVRDASTGIPPRGEALRSGVVVTQIAMSAALLVGAGLLGRSTGRIARVDLGFEVEDRWVLEVGPGPGVSSGGAEEELMAAQQLRDRIAGLPGVAQAALAHAAPPRPAFEYPLALEALDAPPPGGQPPFLPYLAGDQALLEVLGVEVVEGRGLLASDRGTRNVVIDRDLARLLWTGEPAVGRSFRLRSEAPPLTVVGVVDELRLMGWNEGQTPLAMIRPLDPGSLTDGVTVIGRNRAGWGSPPPATARRLAADIFPDHPVRESRTLQEAMASTADQPLFFTALLSVLTGCALFLAALGLYAMVSASVEDRRRELGIRMAVGASASTIRWWVLRRALLLSAAGVAIGAGVGRLGSGVLRHLLFGVERGDPLTFLGVTGIVVAVSAAAAMVPAVRASRLDPWRILRTEG